MICKFLGIQHYQKILLAMQQFTKNRSDFTKDELWFLEHYPVYTQGLAGKKEHILKDIPVIYTDRGGQITYHGPGQLIVYFLLNLNRQNIKLKKLLTIISESMISLLKYYNIIGHIKKNAPGVYVNNQKICSIGLKITKQCTYHGLSLNVNMDLLPFSNINPCGDANLIMTQLNNFIPDIKINKVSKQLSKILINNLALANAE